VYRRACRSGAPRRAARRRKRGCREHDEAVSRGFVRFDSPFQRARARDVRTHASHEGRARADGAPPANDRRNKSYTPSKTGNARMRHVVGEAAWSYRYRPATGRALKKRQEGQSEDIKAIAWKAQPDFTSASKNSPHRASTTAAWSPRSVASCSASYGGPRDETRTSHRARRAICRCGRSSTLAAHHGWPRPHRGRPWTGSQHTGHEFPLPTTRLPYDRSGRCFERHA
jgi:hypothetical protein